MRIELRNTTNERNQKHRDVIENQIVTSFKGKEPRVIKALLEELQGVIDIHELALKYKINITELTKMIENLRKMDFLEVTEHLSKPKILIVSDYFYDLLQEYVNDLANLNNINLFRLKDVPTLEAYDLIIAFDLHHHTPFFSAVSKLALKNKKAWLHFAISPEKIYMGPLFLSDHQLCYESYVESQIFNTVYEHTNYTPHFHRALVYFKKHMALLQRMHKRYFILANRILTFHLDSNCAANVEIVEPALYKNYR